MWDDRGDVSEVDVYHVNATEELHQGLNKNWDDAHNRLP